jgi:hypothetical protein
MSGAALVPGAAQAGTYNVYSCSIDGGFFGNGAWEVRNTYPGDTRYPTDGSCTQAGDPLVAQLAPNNAFPSVSYSGLWFFAPGGTAISDYQLAIKHYWYAPPQSGQPTERTYTLASYGDVFFSGTGLFKQVDQEALNNEGHWYGYRGPGTHSSGSWQTPVMTVRRADSPRARAAPPATYMTISAGCYTDDGSNCSLDTTATAYLQLYGSRVTISDNSAPALVGPAAGQGLRASGTRSGSESVTFSASDNVGIRKAELVDVTDAANPKVAASKDYNSGTLTAQKARCDFTRPLPCPNLSGETIAANPPIAGHRTLLLRVTDAAGNETNSAPFAVYARGAANGVNAGDGAKLIAGFPAKVYRRSKAGKRYYTYVLRPSRTVSYGKGGTLRGTLRTADGQPITGADVRVLVRENRTGALYVDRGGITSDASGHVSLGIPAGSSRTYQLTYKAFVGDDNLAARSKATLNTRARITVRAPRRVRSRGVARFRGTLVGRPRPRRGVTLELQAYQPHRGWRTVATVRTGKSGRFSARYRFNSGGGSFRFRVRLRPNDAYPYARGSSKRVRVRVG